MVCPRCKGFGNLKGQKCEICNQTLRCPDCGGKGWIKNEQDAKSTADV